MRARDNPFATDRVLRIRYELPDGDWAALLARLGRLRYRAAIVGPHGTGKTTLLEDLQDRLRASGVPSVSLRLDTTHPRFSRATLDACFDMMTPAHVVCLDGAEQLTRLAWASFNRRTRTARGLIITSHRAGMLPTLHTCTTNVYLLEQIVSRLLVGPHLRPASQPTPHDLFVRHHGNLRDALREMYDCYATLPS